MTHKLGFGKDFFATAAVEYAGAVVRYTDDCERLERSARLTIDPSNAEPFKPQETAPPLTRTPNEKGNLGGRLSQAGFFAAVTAKHDERDEARRERERLESLTRLTVDLSDDGPFNPQEPVAFSPEVDAFLRASTGNKKLLTGVQGSKHGKMCEKAARFTR